jgi:hypothetical protein
MSGIMAESLRNALASEQGTGATFQTEEPHILGDRSFSPREIVYDAKEEALRDRRPPEWSSVPRAITTILQVRSS